MGLVPLSRLLPVSNCHSRRRDIEPLTIAPYLNDGLSALAAAASLEIRKSLAERDRARWPGGQYRRTSHPYRSWQGARAFQRLLMTRRL